MTYTKASIICVYNDLSKLQGQLLASEIDENEMELILLDNTQGEFQFAAQALNIGAQKAKGSVLIFSHQDIFIKSKKELDTFIDRVKMSNVGDIYGAQGAKETKRTNISNITAGKELDCNFYYTIKQPQEVSCIDEGFFAMRRETFEQFGGFSESLCRDWHLYAVELSLRVRSCGFKVYVDPIQLHHYSFGRISISYMKELVTLCDYYRKKNKYIWTTCYKVRTNYFYIRILYLIWILHRIMIRKPLD